MARLTDKLIIQTLKRDGTIVRKTIVQDQSAKDNRFLSLEPIDEYQLIINLIDLEAEDWQPFVKE